MKNIIEKAESLFKGRINKFGYDPYGLIKHVGEMERWAAFLCRRYPKADREIVMLGVWLHDLGHYPLPSKIDHAIRSEKMAKKFLKDNNYPVKKIKMALHCVRAHRCNDVCPETLEARIVACADSASHMTDDMYFDIARTDRKLENPALRFSGKIERDFRDISVFPEVKKLLTPLYLSWKSLIAAYVNVINKL